MIYFDTAYISKCYLNESGSEEIIELAGKSEGLCSSHFGRLEFFSVLHRHLREGHLSRRQVAKVLENLQEDERDQVWFWLPVTSRLIEQVCERVRRLPKRAFLRAGDALHLGTARENGFAEIYSNDRHLLACAKYFDLMGKNIL